MAERFYLNFPIAAGDVLLQGPEAHHLANVMRAKLGDQVVLFTGDGAEYPATVLVVERKTVKLSVGEPIWSNRELPFHLEIATAMPKGDRTDFLVEKLTELGVTRLVPLRTQRSVAHPRIDRLERTVIEACKQCGRNRLMEIAPLTAWDGYCSALDSTAIKILAHPNGMILDHFRGVTASRRVHPAETSPAARQANLYLAIGPEGGFTDEEVAVAIAAGWQLVDLGPRILRIETAAIALAAYYALGNACKA